jgi:Skp family chaperone for outer membrane proteins
VKPKTSPLLDSLAASGSSTVLNPEAQAALQKRIDGNKATLDRAVYKFKDYRGKALEDMKQLQTQKTYGVMSKIYAVLQGLSRDESITVVLDKQYVLYGEETVDLTERLIERLNQGQF